MPIKTPVELTACYFQLDSGHWNAFIEDFAYISAVQCDSLEYARVVLQILLKEELPEYYHIAKERIRNNDNAPKGSQ